MNTFSTTTQEPIHSGFGPHSTAADVLAGIDLSGKLAVITGGYSGLGLEITRQFVAAGARVIVPARRVDVAEEAVGGLRGVQVVPLDLADLASVSACTAALMAQGEAIDFLIANAAVMACPETRVGPGWESQFATNHLGHFALVSGLWPLLAEGGARVVVVSSGAHARMGMRWDDVHFTHGYAPWDAYGQSKTANILFAQELDRRGVAHGVEAVSVHPGQILTPLQRHLSRQELVDIGWLDQDGNVVNPQLKTIEQGAATASWAATSPLLAGRGGVYCVDCDVAPAEAVKNWATDPAEAARLWRYSVELTGCDQIPRVEAPVMSSGVADSSASTPE